MAEALGVVGSAISIAHLVEQIIESISKLRALRVFLKNAPGELQEFVEEVEVVQAVLVTIRPEAFAFLKFPSTERRLQAFSKDLTELILEISKYRDTTSQRLGLLRLVFKRDILRMHRQNLDNLKSTLLLLQQAHCIASVQELASRIQSPDVSQEERAVALAEEEEIVSRQFVRNRKRQSAQGKPYEYRLRTPWSFVTLTTARSLSGWKFNLQVNNVVPEDSLVFKYAREENLEGLQKLFSSGLASPLDCTPLGTTVIGEACLSGNYEMCRFLVDTGIDPKQKAWRNRDALATVNTIAAYGDSQGKKSLHEIYRLFLDDSEDVFFGDLDPNIPYHIGYRFSGGPETLVLIQNHAFEKYPEIPLTQRFERAMTLIYSLDLAPNPDNIRVVMGGGHRIDPAAFLLEDECGTTLFHLIACSIPVFCVDTNSREFMEWQPLMKEAVSGTPDPNKLAYCWDQWYSPLAFSIRTIIDRFWFRKLWKAANSYVAGIPTFFEVPVNLYLHSILSQWKLAGLDLESFGAKEQALYASKSSQIVLPLFFDSFDNQGTLDLRMLYGNVLHLQYGPEPEDWHLFLTNPIDEFAGEFWELVERSLEVMPGTWVD